MVARIAEVGDLDGRRAMGENAQPIVARQALQIDGDRHLLGAQSPRHIEIAERAHVEEPVEGLADPRARGAAVILAPRHAEHLEPIAVVQLQ